MKWAVAKSLKSTHESFDETETIKFIPQFHHFELAGEILLLVELTALCLNHFLLVGRLTSVDTIRLCVK